MFFSFFFVLMQSAEVAGYFFCSHHPTRSGPAFSSRTLQFGALSSRTLRSSKDDGLPHQRHPLRQPRLLWMFKRCPRLSANSRGWLVPCNAPGATDVCNQCMSSPIPDFEPPGQHLPLRLLYGARTHDGSSSNVEPPGEYFPEIAVCTSSLPLL